MPTSTPQCIVCEQSQDNVPLLTLKYQQNDIWICPQHLPVLIHNPKMLIGKLPGAEGMRPAEHHD